MERFKAPTKFIQYQLWQDCRNGCKFCSEKMQPSINKIVGLTHTLNKLDDPEVFDYQEVGFIGGELFDNQLDDPEVRELFYELFRKVSKMHFDKIYIATALIYDINVYLIPFLNFIKELGIMDKVLLCTSYDLKYRFNKPGKKELWENNMLELYKLFPELVVIHMPEVGICLSDNGYFELPSWELPKGYIKGKTGAGDAFCAGALIGIYRGLSEMGILTLASKAATASLSSPDAIGGMVSEEEIDKRLKEMNIKF